MTATAAFINQLTLVYVPQIHIFNQRVIVALKETHTCILLDKIDPKQCNPALLGPMPASVQRLPFRLHDIPFFDTTFLCDPVMDKYYTPGTGDSDDEWDAPLQRTSTVASRICMSTQMPGGHGGQANNGRAGSSHSNQYAQTNLTGQLGEFTNVLAPFSRDPNATFERMTSRRGSNVVTTIPPYRPTAAAAKGHRSSPGGGGAYSSHSPSPQELRARFESGGGPHSRPGSLKKRAAPRIPTPPHYAAPPPPPSAQRRNSFGKRMHAPLAPTSTYNGTEFRGVNSFVGGGAAHEQRINPVREMQLRCGGGGVRRRGSNDHNANGGNDDDEAPPFNFQAMLRKTAHNRASMKRTLDESNMFHSSDADNFGRTSSPFGETNNNGHVRIRTPDSGSHTVYKSSRPQSRQSNGYDREDAGGRASGTPVWQDRGTSFEDAFYVNEEIQPGMQLEGYAIEI